jgi:hypothetical protein
MIIASLLVTFIVLISCSALLPKAKAVTSIDLESRESNVASVNKGTITLAGKTYSLPSGLFEAPSGSFQITYNPASGFRFVRWETEGGLSFDNSNSQTTTVNLQQETGEVTIIAVYEFATPVGGVVLPTSKLEIVAPFAALAGLIVAVSTVVVVKRRRD